MINRIKQQSSLIEETLKTIGFKNKKPIKDFQENLRTVGGDNLAPVLENMKDLFDKSIECENFWMKAGNNNSTDSQGWERTALIHRQACEAVYDFQNEIENKLSDLTIYSARVLDEICNQAKVTLSKEAVDKARQDFEKEANFSLELVMSSSQPPLDVIAESVYYSSKENIEKDIVSLATKTQNGFI